MDAQPSSIAADTLSVISFLTAHALVISAIFWTV